VSTSPSTESTGKPANRKAEEALPRVEPPGAGFILQLFLIPLLIVTIIVGVWMMFSWLAHLGSDPQELVADIAQGDKHGWQKAATLADLLRNREYDYLKTDVALASGLAEVLDAKIDEGDKDYKGDALEDRLRLRVFLCRALGEFRIDAGLPVLIKAAQTQRKTEEIAVRRAAIQAIAVLASNIGPEKLRDRSELLAVLRKASQERSPSGDDPENAYAELRSNAAFALGILGGADALDRLALVMSDNYPNARYNAATGLARHGDERAIAGLLEMLDPKNQAAVAKEESETEKSWKRSLVHKNGMSGVELLHEANPDADLSKLKAALEKLSNADGVQSLVSQRAAVIAKSL
jgi:HEAT repeat protein